MEADRHYYIPSVVCVHLDGMSDTLKDTYTVHKGVRLVSALAQSMNTVCIHGLYTICIVEYSTNVNWFISHIVR